jgi:hypothetical protein
MANIQFWRSNQMSDTSFLDLVKRTFGKTFTKGIDAKNWLKTNGYYTSYPDIVTDGLVLNLDAANLDSFKGEPTTNLNIYTLSSSTTDGSGQGNIGTRTILLPNHVRIVDNNSNTRQFHDINGLVGGTIYTVSIEYKKISGVPTFRFQLQNNLNGVYQSTIKFTNTTEIGITDRAGWQVASWTFTLGVGMNGMRIWYQDGEDYTTYTHSFELRNPQLEQKSYATPYVNGTRGMTYATNGGWCDLSGNGNHADLSGNVLYNNSNNGTLSLDGASGFINNSAITTSSTCTIVIVYKTTDDTELWVRGQGAGNFYVAAAYPGSGYYQENAGTPTYYADLNQISDPITSGYRNGNYHMWEAKNVNLSTWTTYQWFLYGGSWNLVGSVSIIMVYNRNLTTQESQQNFNAIKERFGL